MDAQMTIKEIGSGDITLQGFDLAQDAGLKTAVIVSLFTDRRALPDDPLPGADDDLRGWWGDTFPDTPRDRIGSRLWLLSREKQLTEVVNRAREYIEEALIWLVEDGIARRVVVSAEIIRSGVLGIGVEIFRPDGSVVDFRFARLWEGV